MDDIDRYEFLSEAIRELDKRASKPESPYWLIDHPVYDEGFSFCWDCLKQMMPDGKVGDDWGGGYCCDSDGCEFCESCHKPLDYTLTDYGVTNELSHFVESGFDWNQPVECFELSAVAHGMTDDDPQRLELFELITKQSMNMPDELKHWFQQYTAHDIASDPDLYNGVYRTVGGRAEYECAGYARGERTVRFGYIVGTNADTWEIKTIIRYFDPDDKFIRCDKP